MSKISGVNVYTAKIPEIHSITDLYPEERNEEIKAANNEKVKAEKFYAWKLLEYAIFHSFGVKLEDLKLYKSDNGKWLCDKCYLSITHSHGVVAVAVSKNSVGIDIEKFEKNKKMIERIFTEEEKIEYDNFSKEEKWQYLLTVFSKKESIYKKEGKGVFLPSKIETKGKNVDVKKICVDDAAYILCTCVEQGSEIKFFHNISLD